MSRLYIIKVWDGFKSYEFTRYGTYDQVRLITEQFPPAYIWSIE